MSSTATSRLEGLVASVAIKAPCRVATTANITLSALQTIDGVALASGDRVLVKDQTDASENGIYVAGSGDWERALDFNGSLDAVGGTQVSVLSGSSNINTHWRVDGTGAVDIGDDDIEFEQSILNSASTAGFLNSGDAVDENVQAFLRSLAKPATSYGATGDGSTDDGPELQAWLNAIPTNGKGVLPPGIYITGQELTIPTDNITIDLQGATIKAKAGAQFEYVLKGASRAGVVVRNGTLDANQSNRSSGQTVRFMGGGFLTSTDCRFENMTAKNTRGYSGTPAVGITASGTRVKAVNCTAVDCGQSGNASDGFYFSGTQAMIVGCTAYNCYDTGFVIESSDDSGIVGCTAKTCGAGAAITNATADAKRGNYISGLTVEDWDSSVTGGVQIGALSTGNLLDTRLDGLVMTAPTRGTGPAINVRKTSSGTVNGLSINGVTINEASAQGILVDGLQVRITDAVVQGTTDACIQFQTGATGSVALSRLVGGSFGVSVNGTASVETFCNKIVDQDVVGAAGGYGVYAEDTSTVVSMFDEISNAATAATGADGGATLTRLSRSSAGLAINGTKVLGAQQTGWTAATGTANKGAFATYAGQDVSAAYVEAEVQAIDDACKANSQRIKALEDALRTHGGIN